jgi:hypothetical protein
MAEHHNGLTIVRDGEAFTSLPSDLLVAYARLSAEDWRDGFVHYGNPVKPTVFEVRINELTKPESEVHKDFVGRIALSLKNSVVILQQIQISEGDDKKGRSVARGQRYTPRLLSRMVRRRRKPYLYVPDLLVPDYDEEIALETLKSLKNVLDVPDDMDIVVDSYATSIKHKGMLSDMGFEWHRNQEWPTPEIFKPFVGDAYPVQQYIGRVATTRIS